METLITLGACAIAATLTVLVSWGLKELYETIEHIVNHHK